MIIEYKLSGADRKNLAHHIAEIVGISAEYQYAPTFAYQIGRFYTVTKEGNLDINDRADSKEVEYLIDELVRLGYGENSANSLTVQMPISMLDERTINRIKRIIENKENLFKAAFQTDNLEIIATEKTVDFPWFTAENDGDSEAFCTFISMLCDFAKMQKRVNYKPCTTDNPKYTMRCFLLRIGMIGTEYKSARKAILRNLSGSSAFRNGGNHDEQG